MRVTVTVIETKSHLVAGENSGETTPKLTSLEAGSAVTHPTEPEVVVEYGETKRETIAASMPDMQSAMIYFQRRESQRFCQRNRALLLLTMKFRFALLGSLLAGGASAFSYPTRTAINVSENIQRDVFTMADWAVSCGVQKADGFQLTTQDGEDYSVYTEQNLPSGSPIVQVPSGMLISSSSAEREFGQYLREAENELSKAKLVMQIPLFRIFVKILVEYEKGDQSPYYYWLNSLPRMYNNGASMTYACFDCLPPYAGWLAMSERINFVNFQKAVKFVQYAGVISESTASNVDVLKWAYNVAATRSIDRSGEKFIAPLADMFNHGSDPEVEIILDQQGNCMVYAAKDVPAGSPLRMSLGDATNPSPMFAKYGFIDETCPATFCKAMHLRKEMEELGYDFSDLLFDKATGDIAMPVYDVFLYSVLNQDPRLKQGFYDACMKGDEATKNSYHQEYFQYTKEALKKHVNDFLRELDELSQEARSKDPRTHPRVPVILQHNAFTKDIFQRVKMNLDSM